MKLANLVAQFIANQGVNHVFGVSGGASLHLIHGFTNATKTAFIPTAHECGAAFAADAYARLRGLGVALATSGPGATNLVTGIAASFYDSTPCLFLTGNVATFRFGAPLGVRQYGFQETPVCDMVRPVTKYAVCVTDPTRIAYELGKAAWYARDGRKGPVLVDIPDDIQRAEVDPAALQHWPYQAENPAWMGQADVERVAGALRAARRPVFVWGAGVRPHAAEARALAHATGVPVACTWGAIDLMPYLDPLMAGGFGTHGSRAANFTVQNADLVIAIGCRLDTKATGLPAHFARGAKVVMVDIDRAEIRKFEKLGRRIDIGIVADAGDFITQLGMADALHYRDDCYAWVGRIVEWRRRYPSVDDPRWSVPRPYALVRALAEHTTPDDVIVSDTGTALGYLMQGFPFKGERFVHAFNATPMGYGLPAAIGAAFASGRRVVLVTGDGSSLMSLGELATLARHRLPVKILLLNNLGHAMCRQTQRQWLGGSYPGTSIEGGLGFPDFAKTADAFGIRVAWGLDELMEASDGPAFMEAKIDPEAQLIPQARFGAPLEDAEPQLSREDLKREMIVETI